MEFKKIVFQTNCKVRDLVMAYSTFSIDLSKKCLLAESATVNVNGTAIPASLFGDVKAESLNNVTFGFKETFAGAFAEANDAIDDVLKPLEKLIQTALGKMPGFDSALKASSLRDAAIFLYSAIGELTGDSSALSSALTDLSTIPTHNMPYRKQPPLLSLGSQKIIIEFAYGKCNLFDAKKEVYEPLKTLQAALFPSVSEKEDNAAFGLSSMSARKIPYQQQVFLQLLKIAFGMNNEGAKTAGKAAAKTATAGLLKTVPAYSADLKKGLKKLVSSNDEGIIRTITGPLNMKVWVQGKYDESGLDKYKKLSHELAFWGHVCSISQGATGTEAKNAHDAGVKQAPEVTPKDIKVKEVSDADLDIFGAQRLASKALNEAIDLLPDYKISKANTWKDETGFYDITKFFTAREKDKDELTTIQKTLAELILLPQRAAGLANKMLYDSFKSSGMNIRIGFGNYQKHSIGEVWTGITEQKRVVDGVTVYNSVVTYNSVIPIDVKIIFNLEDVDDQGYPMSGRLEISDLWNLNMPSSAITFSRNT